MIVAREIKNYALQIQNRFFRFYLSHKIESSFIIISLLGILTGTFFYWKDYFFSRALLENEPVAFVTRRVNISQRLLLNGVLWDRLERGAVLFNGDTVATGNSSGIDILFADNESIFLSENTSAKIFHPAGSKAAVGVELEQGTLTAVSGRFPLTVYSGVNKFVLSPNTKTECRITFDGGLAMTVFSGSALFDTGRGKDIRLEAGEALCSESGGVVSEAPILAMLNPGPDDFIFDTSGGENTRVEFRWRKFNFTADKHFTLELAHDRDFRRPYAQYNQYNENGMALDLPFGKYYWRVFTDNSAPGTAAAFGTFEVLRAPPPETVSPARGRTFYHANGQVSSPAVLFFCSVPEKAQSVLLEVSDNSGMKNPKVSREFERGGDLSFYSRDFGEGTWYWRVSAVYPDGGVGKTVSSQINTFAVTRDLKIESPRLLSPGAAETAEIGSGRQMFFSWEPLSSAVSYTILIAEGESLQNVIINRSVNRNYFVYDADWNILDEGNYYWAVFQTDENGNNSAITEIRSFSARKDNARSKLLFPPDNYITSSAFSPDLFFAWKNFLPFPKLFQISSRSDFSDSVLVEEKLNGAGTRGRFLPPGVYYWRVSTEIPAPDKQDGAKFTKIDSPPMRLVVLPEFHAPGPLSPAEGENVIVTEGVPVNFRWEKLSYADTYDFALFSESTGALLYEISSLSNTGVQAYFSPRAAGNYRWTVRANAGSGNDATLKRGFVRSHRFSIGRPGAAPYVGFVQGVVQAGAVHAPITLTAPMAGSSLVNSDSSPPFVRWYADEPLQNSRVIFSHDEDPAADPRAVIQYIDHGITSTELPALGEGIWYWIVQGDTAAGQTLSAAAPSWFTVMAEPPHASPLYTRPEHGAVVTLDQLMIDRTINFAWEKVQEANAYIFSLYGMADKPELLVSSSPIPDTSFELTDLSILSMDNYVWQVEAVTVTRSGALERRGIIEQNYFSMNIPHSENLRLINQGTVYGQ